MVRADAQGHHVVSVILDSLRRARSGTPAPARPAPAPQTITMARAVPEGLRAGSGRGKPARRLRPAVLIAVIILAVGAWAVVKLSLDLLSRDSTPTSTVVGGLA